MKFLHTPSILLGVLLLFSPSMVQAQNTTQSGAAGAAGTNNNPAPRTVNPDTTTVPQMNAPGGQATPQPQNPAATRSSETTMIPRSFYPYSIPAPQPSPPDTTIIPQSFYPFTSGIPQPTAQLNALPPEPSPQIVIPPPIVLNRPQQAVPQQQPGSSGGQQCRPGYIRSTNATTAGQCIPLSDNFGTDASSVGR